MFHDTRAMFSVGHTVQIRDGNQGQIISIGRKDNGIIAYLIRFSNGREIWYDENDIITPAINGRHTFLNNEAKLGPPKPPPVPEELRRIAKAVEEQAATTKTLAYEMTTFRIEMKEMMQFWKELRKEYLRQKVVAEHEDIETAELLSKSIEELHLSTRARKCMRRLDITTLADLVGHSANELFAARNFGVTTLDEVREKLACLGLKLKGDKMPL